MSLLGTILALTLPVLASGFFILGKNKSSKKKFVKWTLAFSGGFLLSLSFVHFLPELYEHAGEHIGLYVLLGFLVQLVLEFFSGGIEHGHMHMHGKKIPWGVFLALVAHALLEGIPLASQFSDFEVATSHHHHNDNTLLYGIVFHQVPVAVVLLTSLYQSKIHKWKSWSLLFAFAISTPIGMGLGLLFGEQLASFDFNSILAIVVGMFLHISTTIIFETNENHQFNFIKLVSILLGFAVALGIH